MRIVRLASLFTHKYKIATNTVAIENSLRSKITNMWHITNKTYNVLRACANSDVSKPTTDQEVKAVAGYEFCKQLLSIIDYMQANQKEISLPNIKDAVNEIIKLIIENKGDSAIQFPHVSELIFQITPTNTRHDRKLRDELFGKARTGLSKILSIALDMSKEIKQLSGDKTGPLADRFNPTRAPLSEYDIIDFIRQHGIEYGIPNNEDWSIAFRNDPELKEEITTVINALNRGHSPRDAASVKMQVAEILRNYEERKSSNAPLFESAEQ